MLMKYPYANPLPDEGLPSGLPEPAGLAERTADAVVRDVGLRLSELRIKRGITQRELAKAAGVRASVVERVERGRFKGTALRSIARLAAAVGCDVTDLLAPPTKPRRKRGRPPRVYGGGELFAVADETR
jgi:DNA-binding Xre family transcriptional regulator